MKIYKKWESKYVVYYLYLLNSIKVIAMEMWTYVNDLNNYLNKGGLLIFIECQNLFEYCLY